jgi:hypothetical protein
LEKVNLSDNIKKFVDESSIHHMLDESPDSEVFDLDVNEVDFFGVMLFMQRRILCLKVKRSLIPFGRYY